MDWLNKMSLVVHGMRDGGNGNAELCGQSFLLLASRVPLSYFTNIIKGQFGIGAVAAVFVVSKLMNVVSHVFKTRDPLQIGGNIVGLVAIFVIYVSVSIASVAECLGDKDVSPCGHPPLPIAKPYHVATMSLADARFHFVDKPAFQADVPNSGEVRDFILRIANNGPPSFSWDWRDGNEVRVAWHATIVHKKTKHQGPAYA